MPLEQLYCDPVVWLLNLNDLEEVHEKNKIITESQRYQAGKKFIIRDPLTSVSSKSLKWSPSSSGEKGGEKKKIFLRFSWILAVVC